MNKEVTNGDGNVSYDVAVDTEIRNPSRRSRAPRKHAEQRALRREKGTEEKWRRGEIVIDHLPLERFRKNGFPVRQILTHEEWLLINNYNREVLVVDLLTLKETLAFLKPHCSTSGLMEMTTLRVPNQPDLLIVGCGDGSIVIWQLDGVLFPCSRVLRQHRTIITALATSTPSPNQNGEDNVRCLFVSGSMDKTVRLWNALTGECLRVFQEHNKSIQFVAFCEGDVVSVDTHGTIIIRNIGGNSTPQFRHCDSSPIGLEYNKKYLIYVSREYFNLFDLEDPGNNKTVHIFNPKFLVDFKSDNVLYGDSYVMNLYNIKTREEIPLIKDELPRNEIKCFTANSKFVFIATYEDRIVIWDRSNGKFVGEIEFLDQRTFSLGGIYLTDSAQCLFYIADPRKDMYLISVCGGSPYRKPKKY